MVEDLTRQDDEPDILRIPSPPQRRLSRSSIDLRDLEQQQQLQQQHDRVAHTDSAPSMIALENFQFKANKNKSEGFFQPLFTKSNFLHKPLECFHTKSSKKKSEPIESLTIENDNEDLARFIEDNYQYFKKQNGGIDLSADKVCRTLTQLQACSDSDFLTLRNNVECDAYAAELKKTQCKKHKMSALSDSDFIVSFGKKSKRFSLKSKLPLARSILNGKLQKPGKYSALDQQQTVNTNNQTKENETDYYKYKGLNNNLSRSLNGCHYRNNESITPKCIQRVLSEGNETTAAEVAATISGNDVKQELPPTTYDAFDMFIKLFQCEKSNKNICDKQVNSKFNYKIVVNSKEYDYCDNVLVNLKTDSCEKLKRLSDFSKRNKADTTQTVETLSKSNSDQMILLNPCDESLLYNLTSDNIHLNTSTVLVNNLVLSSPPVTPKQLLSPKNINREQSMMTMQYFSQSQHLNPNLFSDTSSMSFEVVSSAPPLEQLIHTRNDSDLLFDFKIPLSSGGSCAAGIATESHGNFIKNNLALTNSKQSIFKCDKNGSADNNNMGLGVGMTNSGSGRIRKPSVTYDINVINKSQDCNIDDICPQRRSYAPRSGSTTSTSMYKKKKNILSNIYSFQKILLNY